MAVKLNQEVERLKQHGIKAEIIKEVFLQIRTKKKTKNIPANLIQNKTIDRIIAEHKDGKTWSD